MNSIVFQWKNVCAKDHLYLWVSNSALFCTSLNSVCLLSGPRECGSHVLCCAVVARYYWYYFDLKSFLHCFSFVCSYRIITAERDGPIRRRAEYRHRELWVEQHQQCPLQRGGSYWRWWVTFFTTHTEGTGCFTRSIIRPSLCIL